MGPGSPFWPSGAPSSPRLDAALKIGAFGPREGSGDRSSADLSWSRVPGARAVKKQRCQRSVKRPLGGGRLFGNGLAFGASYGVVFANVPIFVIGCCAGFEAPA